jgi:uncharacterized RDD family membrane protein YckC
MKAITVLNKGNVPTGPFTRAEVATKLQNGECSLEDLAFVEGLSQWTPLRDVLALVDGTVSPASEPPPYASLSSAPTTAAPAYSYAATMEPPTHFVYAGFWLRFVAYLIDYLILDVPLLILSTGAGFIFGLSAARSHSQVGFLNSNGTLNAPFITLELVIFVVSITLHWLYFALQECSSAQATLGKRVLGLKVIDLAGQRIGFGQATGRFFGKIVSGLTFCIGYIMAGVTERKQALHDMIASTLVIRG